jgi:hypothetical protein
LFNLFDAFTLADHLCLYKLCNKDRDDLTFLGIFGVMQTIDLQAYSQPLFQIYVLSIPAIAALIVANIIVVRKEGHDMKRAEH